MRLPDKVNRLISGTAPSDPLYLSNRTMADRLKPWIAAGILGIALCVGLEMARSRPRPVQRVEPLMSSAKLAAVGFPTFESSKLEVLETAVVPGKDLALVGAVRNKTDQVIALGRLAFELDDADGQWCGTIGAELKQIEPGKIVRFHVPIVQRETRSVQVTEISVE